MDEDVVTMPHRRPLQRSSPGSPPLGFQVHVESSKLAGRHWQARQKSCHPGGMSARRLGPGLCLSRLPTFPGGGQVEFLTVCRHLLWKTWQALRLAFWFRLGCSGWFLWRLRPCLRHCLRRGVGGSHRLGLLCGCTHHFDHLIVSGFVSGPLPGELRPFSSGRRDPRGWRLRSHSAITALLIRQIPAPCFPPQARPN